MKWKSFPAIALILCWALSGCGTAACHSAETQEWGPTVEGLRMSLSISKAGNPGNPEFNVLFQNLGTNDIALNLGYMLANGKYQVPDKIGLNIKDNHGKLLKTQFFDRRFAAISGRVDDYAIPLRAGSIYALKVQLDQFYSPEDGIKEMKLERGKYKISAEFQGVDAKALNTSTADLRLMNFWKGKLQSNIVTVAK